MNNVLSNYYCYLLLIDFDYMLSIFMLLLIFFSSSWFLFEEKTVTFYTNSVTFILILQALIIAKIRQMAFTFFKIFPGVTPSDPIAGHWSFAPRPLHFARRNLFSSHFFDAQCLYANTPKQRTTPQFGKFCITAWTRAALKACIDRTESLKTTFMHWPILLHVVVLI